MDQVTLVGNRIDDGRRFVERFAADGNPVHAAFWGKTAEEGLWFLYVATDLVDREGPAAAYRAVNASLRKLGEYWPHGSSIKVIGPSDPIAKDVLEVMTRYPARLATRLSGRSFGAVEFDQAYIYPSHFFTFAHPNPMTTEDIGREIFRLMNREGVFQQSRVFLKDGTSFDGAPFSIQIGSRKALEVHFIADGETAPRVVQLDEIASIA